MQYRTCDTSNEIHIWYIIKIRDILSNNLDKCKFVRHQICKTSRKTLAPFNEENILFFIIIIIFLINKCFPFFDIGNNFLEKGMHISLRNERFAQLNEENILFFFHKQMVSFLVYKITLW